MKTRPFIGKTVSFEKLQQVDADIYPPGEFDDEFTVAEIYLGAFECGITDRTGRNAYSVHLHLDQDRIVKVVRIGHCHMCGGQGSDDEFNCFPHRTLEQKAHDILTTLLV